MSNRVTEILDNLETLRENLLALSDDIWIDIDHNDPDALEAGIEFKRRYNEAMLAFTQASDQLSGLVQRYTRTHLDEEVTASEATDDAENERIIRSLDKTEAHFLGENFSYKRPWGFVLAGRGTENVRTWKRLYVLVCKQLADRDPARFASLPGHEDYVTTQGHHDFRQGPDTLRTPVEIAGGIYAETHFSANDIAKRIRRLLKTFDLDPTGDFAVYLREDRNAELEA